MSITGAKNDRLSILISGAGIAGPTLAYWLRRRGFAVTPIVPGAITAELSPPTNNDSAVLSKENNAPLCSSPAVSRRELASAFFSAISFCALHHCPSSANG